MTPELFRVLMTVIGVLITVLITLLISMVKGQRRELREFKEHVEDQFTNHCSEIKTLIRKVARIEGWLEPKHGGGKL